MITLTPSEHFDLYHHAVHCINRQPDNWLPRALWPNLQDVHYTIQRMAGPYLVITFAELVTIAGQASRVWTYLAPVSLDGPDNARLKKPNSTRLPAA